MNLRERSADLILPAVTLFLALAAGIIIAVLSGGQGDRGALAWTPPPPATPTSSPTSRAVTPVALGRAAQAAPSATRATATSTAAPTVSPTAATPSPTASLTPQSTQTARVTPPAASPTRALGLPLAGTVTPTRALTAEPTRPPQASVVQVVQGPLSLRAGPGPSQPLIAIAAVGDTFTITARTADSTWWQVCCINGRPVWLAAEFTQATGNLTALPIQP